ncbi:hypothetical protein V8B97DRAFT_1919025 [Scleroderma yunnanense]
MLSKEQCYQAPKKQEHNPYTMDVNKAKYKAQQSQANGMCFNCGGDHFKHNCLDLNRGQPKPNQKQNSHKARIKELKAEVEKLEKERSRNGNNARGTPSSEKDF